MAVERLETPGLEEFSSVLEEASRRLEPWEPVVGLGESRIVFVGDTHGYPEVTLWALELARDAAADAVVFIGDFVDRGPRGVENLYAIAKGVVEGEVRVVPVRGDHESLLMNTYYGFRGELHEKLGPEAEAPVGAFYASLPLAATAGPLFIAHGGIPCRRCLMEEEEPFRLEEIRAALEEELAGAEARAHPETPVATHLMWNDPRGIIDWFLPNSRGPGTYYYGRMAWRRFLEANGFKAIIRGHEVYDGLHIWTPDGGQVYPVPEEEAGLEYIEGAVVTVFSSLYHGARAAALLVDLQEGIVRPYYYAMPGVAE